MAATTAERYLVRVQTYRYDPRTKGVKMTTIASRSMTAQGAKPILDILQRTETPERAVRNHRGQNGRRREKA
jgi:hypothetical protein